MTTNASSHSAIPSGRHPAILCGGLIAVAMLGGIRPSMAAACTFQRSSPATVAFLLDLSGTVPHFEAFERAWQEVVSKSADGDTVMLAVVKRDARGGIGEFPYLEKQRFPCYSPFATRTEYERKRTAALSALQGAFAAAMSLPKPTPSSDRTLLLSSVRDLAKAFAETEGPRVLVFATDGLEDSDIARFERTTLTDAVISRLIERERTPDLVRHLKGVSVYVVAAGTSSDAKSREVERFWLAYFKEMGARLSPARYAGNLLHYAR